MSILATIPALPTRTAADRARILVDNIVANLRRGGEMHFQVGIASMRVERLGEHWVFSCVDVDWEGEGVTILRSVSLFENHDGEGKRWQVLRSGGAVVAESHAVRVAVCDALVYAGAVALASRQDEHDPTGC